MRTSPILPPQPDSRRQREQKTIVAMVRIYCRDHHQTNKGLCAECAALQDYALRRLRRCVFTDQKPTCLDCTVHCYSRSMQQRIREIMRYAGPRMLLRHPYLAISHLLDKRKPVPELKQTTEKQNQKK